MLVPDLRKIIEEMSGIRMRIKKNGDFYKQVLWVGEKRHVVRAERWIPITLEETLTGLSPSASVLYAHNELCNASQRLQNAWIKVRIYLLRNSLDQQASASRMEDMLRDNLHLSARLFEELRARMSTTIDYAFQI